MDDLLNDFLIEALDLLETVDSDLLAIERGDLSKERVSSLFRGLHTIKGTCSFLGLPRIETLAHRGEAVLVFVRDGHLTPDSELISVLLKVSDRLRAVLVDLAGSGSEPDGNDQDLLVMLDQWLPSSQSAAPHDDLPSAEAFFDAPPVSEPAPSKPEATPKPAPAAPAQPEAKAAAPSAEAKSAAPAAAAQTTGSDAATDSSIRLNTTILDRLMNQVGELVLLRNRFLMHTRSEDEVMSSLASGLDRLTSEIQRTVLTTRLQPVSTAWSRLPRLVRDTSRQLGKNVELVMEGENVELDKAVIDAVRDPFTHLVRNSLDHGIEEPAARKAAGKPQTAYLKLIAEQVGNQVYLHVQDDGRGIDPAKIRAKAVSKGMLTQAEADALSDREAVNLIFGAGFSTAEVVTNVSGRGVGMDVVRTNIEQLGGAVEVTSELGAGTTITLRIPLTLAILQALLVQVQDELYAIPQVSVTELVAVGGKTGTPLQRIGKSQVIHVRDRALPVVSLHEFFGIGTCPDKGLAIICTAGKTRVALLVDAALGTQEIVVKPLGMLLKGLTTYGGASLLGDGRVALILEPSSFMRDVYLQLEEGVSLDEQVEVDTQKESILVVDAGRRRLIIPVKSLMRIEKTDAADRYYLRGSPVMPYRGGVLPLVDLMEGQAPDHVIICRHRDMLFGVLASSPGSVEQIHINPLPYEDQYVSGTQVVQGKVAEYFNLDDLADLALPITQTGITF